MGEEDLGELPPPPEPPDDNGEEEIVITDKNKVMDVLLLLAFIGICILIWNTVKISNDYNALANQINELLGNPLCRLK